MKIILSLGSMKTIILVVKEINIAGNHVMAFVCLFSTISNGDKTDTLKHCRTAGIEYKDISLLWIIYN